MTSLVGDIGGTNARFALATDSGFDDKSTYTCADFESAGAAIKTYLQESGVQDVARVVLAVAGPVDDGRVAFTNSSWRISERELCAELDVDSVRLINDFEAVAHATRALTPDQLYPVGTPKPTLLSERRDYTVAVLGPGTGLGVSACLSRGSRRVALRSEGGHVGFAPENDQQDKILSRLRTRFSRVSDERLVSGQGVENVYWALAERDEPPPSAEEIFTRCLDASDGVAQEAVNVMLEVLGQVAGNLVLMTGAYEGVYLAGGVIQRYPDLLAHSRFRAGFENKGRHRALMESVPTSLVMHPQPGLLGAAAVAAMADRSGSG